MPSKELNSIIQRLFSGDRQAIAQVISIVENDHPKAHPLLREIYPNTGSAYRIGITGPPGAGKSTITNKLARLYREKNLNVGIIAVDPTSPFTGGALLGDRIRMTDVELDEGVFIRSMASRGSLGGLSKKANEAADVLDAAGKQVIIMETVGVGQSELDIASAADTTAVVLVPESGDSIQAMKAGLMEIADFIVLNKSDRAGADQAVLAIKTILNFKQSQNGWNPDVIKSIASEGKGIDQIAAMIEQHRSFLESSGILRRKREERLMERIKELVSQRLQVEFWSNERKSILQEKLKAVLSHQSTPYDVVEELTNDFQKQ